MEKSHDFFKQQNRLIEEAINLGRPLTSFNCSQTSKVARGCYHAFRLCIFTHIHTVYSGNSMKEEPWFLDMNPGIGLAAEVLVEPQPEEVSQS